MPKRVEPMQRRIAMVAVFMVMAGLTATRDNHGERTRHHPMDPVSGSRAGNRRRLPLHHAIDGRQADL